MAVAFCFGPFLKPFQLPGLQPNEFPPGQWVTVVDWTGMTVQTLVHTVSANPATAVVKWRRTGLLPLPLKEGSFQGEADFNVYPSDVKLKIELWVDDPNVTINVSYRGAVI